MNWIECSNPDCRKKLGKVTQGSGYEIKCPRCKTISRGKNAQK